MVMEVKVPVFPESVADGTLVKWHKAVGEAVHSDEILADIETDKVVFEVSALCSGVLTDVLVEEGETVISDQVIAHLEESAKAAEPMDTEQASAAASSTEALLTPSASRLIEEHQLDAGKIQGTGMGGRILKEDVLPLIEATSAEVKPKAAAPVAVDERPVGERPQKRVPMSRLRARVAERLLEAQQTAAILTTFNEINMQPVKALRERYREAFEKVHGVRLGFMSFFVKAVVEGLRRFPEVNASIEGDDIVYHGFYDIGIAVGSPRGLVVPILRDADQLGMAEIEQRIRDFGQRAQKGSITIDEMSGGTFSITNGGVFGSLLSTPILNPPQSGILGMHTIQERPVVEAGEIVIRPMMYVALSYDHRLIDGREAVQFLVTVKEMLEDPSRLLLEV